MSKTPFSNLARTVLVAGFLGLSACSSGLLTSAITPLTGASVPGGEGDASGNNLTSDATTTSSTDVTEDGFDVETDLQQDSQPVSIYVPIAKDDDDTMTSIEEVPDPMLLTAALGSADTQASAVGFGFSVAYADDGVNQEISVQGQAGAANPSYDITFTDETSGALLSQITPQSDGSFATTLDDAYLDRNVLIAYLDPATGDTGDALGLTVYSNGNFKIDMPTQAAATTRYTVSGKYLVTSTESAGGYEFAVNPLDGAATEPLADSDAAITGLGYFPGASGEDYLIGLIDKTELVRLDHDGRHTISDNNDGDVLPDGSTLDVAKLAAAVRPLGDGVLVQGFSSANKALRPLLIPTDPEQADTAVTFDDQNKTNLLNREWVWRDTTHLLALSRYQDATKTAVGQKSGPKTYHYAAETIDLTSYFPAADDSGHHFAVADPSGSMTELFTTPFPISAPAATPIGTSEPFFAFVCGVENVKQICLSHYDGDFEVLTTGTENKSTPTISADGLFVAYEQFDADETAQIMVRHIASGDTFSLTSGSGETALVKKITARRPQFTRGGDNKFVLMFMTGNKKIGFKPTILNLAMHPSAGRYISGSPYYDGGDDGSQ